MHELNAFVGGYRGRYLRISSPTLLHVHKSILQSLAPNRRLVPVTITLSKKTENKEEIPSYWYGFAAADDEIEDTEVVLHPWVFDTYGIKRGQSISIEATHFASTHQVRSCHLSLLSCEGVGKDILKTLNMNNICNRQLCGNVFTSESIGNVAKDIIIPVMVFGKVILMKLDRFHTSEKNKNDDDDDDSNILKVFLYTPDTTICISYPETTEYRINKNNNDNDIYKLPVFNTITQFVNESLSYSSNGDTIFSHPRCLFLAGSRGSGKTKLVSQLSNNMNLFYVSTRDILMNSSDNNELQRIYDCAVTNSPSVMCIDDMDLIFANKQETEDTTGDDQSDKLNTTCYQFLQLIEKHIQLSNNICIISIVNNMSNVPSILRRADRIRHVISIPALTEDIRIGFLKHILNQGSPFPLCTVINLKNMNKNDNKNDNNDNDNNDNDNNDNDDNDNDNDNNDGTLSDVAILIGELTPGFNLGQLISLINTLYINCLSQCNYLKSMISINNDVILDTIRDVARDNGISNKTIHQINWNNIHGYGKTIAKLKLISEQWRLTSKDNIDKKLLVNQTNIISSGIILHGPSGCGKTFLANAIGSINGLNFLTYSAADIFSRYLGDSEKKICDIFATAKGQTPCVIFLDQLDSIAISRDGVDSTGSTGVESRVLSTLLNELDGIENLRKGVFLIGATNNIDNIDSALIRPGRFDVLIHIDYPDDNDRFRILNNSLESLSVGDDVDIDVLVDKTKGWTCAQLGQLTRDAVFCMLREDINNRNIEMKHFMECFKNVD